MIRAKILLLATFCLFSLCFCALSVLGEGVTKENGVILYREWKDYTEEEKDKLKSRWTKDDKYKNISKFIIKKKSIPKGVLTIKGSDGRERYDLRGIDLLQADLQGANLILADLQGAILLQANLQGADLSFANLQGANLIGADLGGANLEDSNLENVYLFSTYFGYTRLSRTNLHKAKYIRNIIWGEKYAINDKVLDYARKKVFPQFIFPEEYKVIEGVQSYFEGEDPEFFYGKNSFIDYIIDPMSHHFSPRVPEDIKQEPWVVQIFKHEKAILSLASEIPYNERYMIGEEKNKEFSKAITIYRDLKSLYTEERMNDVASEFHYRENVVKTELSSQPIRIFRTVFLDWTYGYGSRPLNLIYFSFGVIFVFTFIYLLLTLPRETDSGIYVITNDGKKEELLPFSEGKILFDCFYFSLLSFATFGYGALQPKQWLQFFYLEPVEFKPVRWARIFVGFEAAIGIYLLALTALVLFKG